MAKKKVQPIPAPEWSRVRTQEGWKRNEKPKTPAKGKKPPVKDKKK
jgi:hypothetical protein